jgi:hypothetical protein
MNVSINEVGSAPSLMWERLTKREDVTARVWAQRKAPPTPKRVHGTRHSKV